MFPKIATRKKKKYRQFQVSQLCQTIATYFCFLMATAVCVVKKKTNSLDAGDNMEVCQLLLYFLSFTQSHALHLFLGSLCLHLFVVRSAWEYSLISVNVSCRRYSAMMRFTWECDKRSRATPRLQRLITIKNLREGQKALSWCSERSKNTWLTLFLQTSFFKN